MSSWEGEEERGGKLVEEERGVQRMEMATMRGACEEKGERRRGG